MSPEPFSPPFSDNFPNVINTLKINPTILDKSPWDSTAVFINFSVISRFPIKTVHPFGNFLAVLPIKS